MGKHHADNEQISLGEAIDTFMPTMVITDYVSALTVHQALVNAANDFNRLAGTCQANGNLVGAQRFIGNAERCRNLAAMAHTEATRMAGEIADANGYAEVI